jgi:hypothetical protein
VEVGTGCTVNAPRPRFPIVAPPDDWRMQLGLTHDVAILFKRRLSACAVWPPGPVPSGEVDMKTYERPRRLKATWLGLVVAASLPVHLAAASRPPDDPITAGWTADLALFANTLPVRHANAFHLLSKSRFDAQIAALRKDITMLNPDQFWVRLDQIENSIGDGHTFMRLPSDAPRFGVAFKRFAADYRVVAVVAASEWPRALGARLVSIDGVAIAKVRTKLLSLTPQDELLPLREFRAQGLLSNGLVLHGLGVTSNRNRVSYGFLDDRGHRFRIDATAIQLPPLGKWKNVVAVPPISQQGIDQALRCTAISPPNTMYCSFRSYEDLRSNARTALEAINRAGVTRLIVDMRENGGGNFCHGLEYLVKPIASNLRINRDGHLFVLIGQQTFSAAMSNAVHFRQLSHAILVGQTIGEKPDSYQEIDDIKLPNTGWMARYSTQYYRFSNGGPNIVRPDIPIAITWAAYRKGRDEVLDYISALPNSGPVRPLVRPTPLAHAAESRSCVQS